MKILSNKNQLFVWAIIYRLLLEFSYIQIISPFYSYSGFKVNFDVFNYAMSWLIFIISQPLLKDKMLKVGDCFFTLAVLLVIIPMSVLYGYDSNRELLPLATTYLAIAVIYLISAAKSISFRSLPKVKGGIQFTVILSLLFVVGLVCWYFAVGVKLNLDFRKVYEFRDENAELAASGILAYTNNWTFKIFNIVLFSFALLYKRYFWAVVFLLVQVYFFAASAHKSVLFLPFMVMGIWLFLRKTNSLLIIPLALAGLALITIMTNLLFNDILASSLFVRRVLFVPAHLTFVYFEYFNDNVHVLWSNSVLSRFSEYPYDRPISKLIGAYLGNEEMRANNGFVASAFAHAGLIGVLLYSVIIGFIIKFLNDVTYDALPLWFAMSLSIIPLRSLLVSSDLFTIMLTHGFIVALFVIFMSRSNRFRQS